MIQRRTAAAFGVLLLEGFRGPGTPVSAHRLDFNDYRTPRCVLRAAVRAGHAHSAGLCTSGPRKAVDGADGAESKPSVTLPGYRKVVELERKMIFREKILSL